MKTAVLLTALLLAFGDIGALAQPLPAGPPKSVQKKQAKVKMGKKAKKKGVTHQEARKLQKKAEQDAKKHIMDTRKREFRMMQESQHRAVLQMQQSQGQQPPSNTLKQQ